jgi:hypothetical protein
VVLSVTTNTYIYLTRENGLEDTPYAFIRTDKYEYRSICGNPVLADRAHAEAKLLPGK